MILKMEKTLIHLKSPFMHKILPVNEVNKCPLIRYSILYSACICHFIRFILSGTQSELVVQYLCYSEY